MSTAVYGGNSNNDGTLNNQGSNANYWSSSYNNTNNAYNLNVNSNNSNVNNNNKNNGLTIRCIRNLKTKLKPFQIIESD